MSKLDKLHGLGRRKSAVVRVALLKDVEQRQVNELKVESYFTPVLQKVALGALEITSQLEIFGFKARAHGGGKRAQAEALRLGIARALVKADDAYKKQLKAAGFLTRDARVKERKKPGLKRARRAPQFSKR